MLVVDNEEADRELLLRLLQPLGFELRTAASGHDALDLLATGYRPDAILMDLAMPGIDGWETIRRLRLLKGGAVLPVAIVSATMGPLGGARVQYDLRRSLSGLGVLDLVKPEIFINNAHTKFDAAGKLTDEATLKIMQEQMVAFQDWIVRMKRAYP